MPEQCKSRSPLIPGLRCERHDRHDGWHRAELPHSTPERPEVVSWP